MNLYEFSKQLNYLKKSYKYEELIQTFENNKHNFPKEAIKSNKWIIANYLTALKKTNNAIKADDFLKNFDIEITNGNIDEIILNSYSWCLYYNLKNNKYSPKEIIQKLSIPLKLLFSKNSKFSYTIISNILREGIKLAKETKNNNFSNKFCNLFDRNKLSTEENIFNIQGKKIIQASDKERWYSFKSKVLFELKSFEECFEISQEILNSMNKFHNNNELWFARRMALSKKELGDIQSAIIELEKIYKKKQEWFIQKEIAELYFENREIEKAFKNSILAVNSKAPIEFKIGLIFLLGKILKQKNENLLAYKHFVLVKNIREEKGWKITEKLENEINSFDFDKKFETKNLIKELQNYWSSYLPKKELLKGTITKILHNNERGIDGFIKSNKDYYFIIPKYFKISDKIAINKKVEFEKIILSNGKERAKIIKVLY
jgi:hypothetical protein